MALEPECKCKLSMSELRGIFLVVLGTLALGFYYSWWFQEGRLTSPWLLLGFVAAIFYGGMQVWGSWLVYLATHHRSTKSYVPNTDLTVDVFVTACGEDYLLIEQSLTAACAMRGEHHTWLLDDGQDPALAQMAKRLGTGYLTRQERRDAKAGNINAALARTDGEIVVIFDIDHIPKPDFLEQTLSYFADPLIGFVQVMPTFSNIKQSWVARAAAETSLDFYNPTSKGMDGLSSVTKMGSNALIRRAALNSIGGYQPGLAEDLATSIALHAAGWHSAYVAEPLAPGLAPADLVAWFTQQFKWSRGVFELLLTTYPRLFTQLSWGQRLSYAVRMTKYGIGPVVCVHLILTIALLISGNSSARADLQQYFVHLIPIALADMLIRQLALRRWRHPAIFASPMWRAVTLVYATWPIYTLAWIMALFRLPLAFRPTPKSPTGGLNLLWLLPQAIMLLMLTGGVVYLLAIIEEYNSLLLSCFALFQAIPQVSLLGEFLHSRVASQDVNMEKHSVNSQTVS